MENDEFYVVERFIEFLNTDIPLMKDRQLKPFIMNYANFVTHNCHKHKLPGQSEKFRLYEKGLERQTSGKVFAQRKDFFHSIQKHLQKKIELLMESLQKTDQIPIFKSLPGDYRILFDPTDNTLKASFVASEKLKETKKLDLDIEKDLADIALADLLIDHKLFPDRFKKCPACGNYFYQPTAREKTYCSTRCGNTMRQRKRYQATKESKV